MTQHYFAIPTSDRLHRQVEELMANLEGGSPVPQNALMQSVSIEFVDEIVDALILNLVTSLPVRPVVATLARQFAQLIKGTSHVAIKQVVVKLDNEDLRPLLGYIRARQFVTMVDGVARHFNAFPIPAALKIRFFTAFAAARHDHGEAERETLRQAMLEFSAKSLYHFYEEPVGLLQLGFVARKVVETGHSAIRKGAQAAINTIFPTLTADEMKYFSAYFEQFFQDVGDE